MLFGSGGGGGGVGVFWGAGAPPRAFYVQMFLVALSQPAAIAICRPEIFFNPEIANPDYTVPVPLVIDKTIQGATYRLKSARPALGPATLRPCGKPRQALPRRVAHRLSAWPVQKHRALGWLNHVQGLWKVATPPSRPLSPSYGSERRAYGSVGAQIPGAPRPPPLPRFLTLSVPTTPQASAARH